MKWHKFLVYFLLWAGALLNVSNAYRMLTGSIYGEYREQVYSMISGLGAVDKLYGVLLIVVAALQVYTAVQLLRFKAGAPKLLLICFIVSGAVGLLYTIIASAILSGYGVDLGSVTANSIGSIAGSVLMIVLNRIYYNKRAHLFVN